MRVISLRCFRLPLIALGFLLAAAPAARAVEPTLAFLHALQRAGYGEAGVAYLESLAAENKVPKELKETYDLEMALCVRDSVNEAFNATERKSREEEFKRLAQKFVDEHPQSTEVARAREILGGSAYDKALVLIAESKITKEKAEKTKKLEEARKSLQEARPGLEKSAEAYRDRFEKLQTAGVKGTTRQKATQEQAILLAKLDWLEAQLKTVLSVYYQGQTYADPKSGPRIETLKQASKQFDDIYQDNRTEVNVFGIIGRFAHLYDGKCAEEMGKLDLAQDIYDEVRSGEDPTAKEESHTEKLMAEAANFSMQITLQKKGIDAYMDEAGEWLKNWDAGPGVPDNPAKKAYRKANGYQAISLQYVKGLLQRADKASGLEKTKLIDQARKRLREIVKVQSDSLTEAIHLAKQLKGGEGGEGAAVNVADVKDFNEAYTLATAAGKDYDWETALLLYGRALELAANFKDREKEKETKRISEARSGLEQSQVNVALARWKAERLNDAYELASQAAQSPDSESIIAPKAASICVQILSAQYATAKGEDKEKLKSEKDAILARLDKVAAFTLKKWGDRPEGDEVRIALGRTAIARGQMEEASKWFEQVNPRSEKFAQAQQIAGQLHYYHYVQEKAKPEADRDMKAVDAERDQAEKQLSAAVEELQKTVVKGDPLPPPLVEVQLLLADLRYHKADNAGAAALLQPLVDNYKDHKPAAIDKDVLKTFYLAVRSYNAAGDFAKGGAVAETLVDFGDSPEVNGISVDFVRSLAEEYKVAELALGDAKTEGDAAKIDAAEAKAFSLKNNLTKLLDKLATKQNQSLKSCIYMGATAEQIGNSNLAEAFYTRALEKAEKDPASVEGDVAKAIIRVRANLVGLMQLKGQFQAGVAEIDKLIASQPRALEPKVVRARLMQGWAEQLLKDKKDATKLGPAIGEWANLRNMLRNMKEKPPEYYEANYYAAYDCWLEYENTKNPVKADDARKLLRTMLVQSPKLSGAGMVARYNQLLAKIVKTVGEGPLPANKAPAKPVSAKKN